MVGLNDERVATISLLGPLVYPLQTVPAGELHAATQFLRHAVAGARLGYDAASIGQGIKRGRKWCCAARHAYADLWRISGLLTRT